MVFPVEVAGRELKNIIGDLTAAGLLIPVAMTFQNLAQLLVGAVTEDTGLLYVSFVLALVLLLSFVNVVFLSVSMTCFRELGGAGQLLIMFLGCVFVGVVLLVGALTIPQPVGITPQSTNVSVLQCALLAIVLPFLAMRIFVKWEGLPRTFADFEWTDLCDVLVVCYIAIILFPPTAWGLFDQPRFPVGSL